MDILSEAQQILDEYPPVTPPALAIGINHILVPAQPVWLTTVADWRLMTLDVTEVTSRTINRRGWRDELWRQFGEVNVRLIPRDATPKIQSVIAAAMEYCALVKHLERLNDANRNGMVADSELIAQALAVLEGRGDEYAQRFAQGDAIIASGIGEPLPHCRTALADPLVFWPNSRRMPCSLEGDDGFAPKDQDNA
jgi:hypothetical protein